jgi:hypothetical protein
MKIFKGITIAALVGSIIFDYYTGAQLNIIYLFALIAVLLP